MSSSVRKMTSMKQFRGKVLKELFPLVTQTTMLCNEPIKNAVCQTGSSPQGLPILSITDILT